MGREGQYFVTTGSYLEPTSPTLSEPEIHFDALALELAECRRLAPKYHATPEVRLADGTRVDLVTATHAIEVDWPRRWAEAPGQAVHYARHTSLKPGVLLLVSNAAKEMEHVANCAWLCGFMGVQLWLEYIGAE